MTNNKIELEKHLWKIANDLRGKMGADEFRDYILGFIFFKYLSLKIEDYANKILAPDGLKYNQITPNIPDYEEYLKAIKKEAVDNLGYFLKPDELFHVIAEKGDSQGAENFILDDLSTILNNIAKSTMGAASEDDFESLFEDIDLQSSKLGRTDEDRNKVIVRVLGTLDKIDFQLDNHENDFLGDAYEYLIGEFASGAGKKAGEFYTPQEVSMVLAKIVTTGKTQLKNVYDPTCGSGSLLLRVAREFDDETKKKIRFYGQESNPTTYNLCRMNMIMHNVHYTKFNIKNEDTLVRPQHKELKFDAVVANPPFSANWSANDLMLSDDRFAPYGRLAPKTKADFAFVQHMIYQLDDEGAMACVLPHGTLFRGAAEGVIRKHLIDELNCLDAVIGLPANIFFGTSIPTCILVIKKQRENTDDILLIDASQGFTKEKNQNKLKVEDIEKIVSTYRNRKELDKYSHKATIEEIKENDYNLNIPRYVDTFEEEEPIDLDTVATQISALEKDLATIDQEIAKACDELNIQKPF